MSSRGGIIGFEGAPSSGKSTTLDNLQTCRLKVPEMARLLLKSGNFGGNSIKEVIDSGNYPRFQKSVVLLNKRNSEVYSDEGAIGDATNVTAQAYVQDLKEPLRQYLLNKIASEMVNNPPRKCLVFEPLPYAQDGVRHESANIQKIIHNRIIKFLDESGIDYTIIPRMSLDLRMKLVKHELKK
jgi:predicted ATPase